MKLENTFEVPAPPEVVWPFLLDVENVAPCMPGAELTDVVDETTWKGKVTVKLGPVSLAYKGTVNMTERDESGRRIHLDAKGTEMRGKGTASAKVTSQLESTEGGGTRTTITTDLTITGQAAQYGRGMIQDVSQRLTGEFADCLADRLRGMGDGSEEAASREGAPGGDDAPAGAGGPAGASGGPDAGPRQGTKPVSGLRLGLWALVRAIGRGLRRLRDAVVGLFRGR